MEIIQINDSNRNMTQIKNNRGYKLKSCGQKCGADAEEFARNTTFHGLRYLVENHSVYRRLMWLVFVLACLTAVILQIVDRVQYFYSRPISVNVKINYNQTLQFPAVTVCNQNSFRASEAYKLGRYRLIEDMFSRSRHISVEDLERHHAANLSMEELYMSLAHRKEDFIVECVWKNGNCSYEDFKTIITDHGVCYQFKQTNHEMLVSSSGVESGLRLTLNVEQYEYMTGPHDAAGIKILLHDPRERPFVHELGLAVPTGAHAFIGVKFMTIDNLPKPHGECDTKEVSHTDYYTTEECYADCMVMYAEERCGCRDSYMPDINGQPPVCTLEQYFTCLNNLKDEFSTSLRESCGCPVPCHFALYDPSVSYATVSNHLINKLLTSNEANRLAQRLEEASEVTSKMENETYTYFVSLANDFFAKYEDMKDVIKSVENCLREQKNISSDIVEEMTDAYNTKERMYRYQDYSVEKNFLRAREAMEERTLNNVAIAYAQFAMINKRRIIRLAKDNETDESSRLELYRLIYDDLKVRQEIAEMARENITLLIDSFMNGTPIFDYKFEDLPRSHNDHIVPKPLLNYSMHYNHYVQKYVPKLQGTDFDVMYSALERFIEQAQIAYHNRTVNETELNYVFERFQFACRTFMFSKSVVYTQGIELPNRVIQERLNAFRDKWAVFYADAVDLNQNTKALTTSLDNISQHILPIVDSIILDIESYTTNRTGTLMAIAEMLLSNETNFLVNLIKDFFQEVQRRGQQLCDLSSLMEKPVLSMWETILTDEDSFDYYNFTDNELFLRHFDKVEHEWKEKFKEFRKKDVRRQIYNKDEDFFKSHSVMVRHFHNFKESIVVDGNFLKQNFLQTDIFYRQLSYEHVNQQKAYDFFALISDIGGAMGLFIGASMLTIVEIIDLLLMQLPVFKR